MLSWKHVNVDKNNGDLRSVQCDPKQLKFVEFSDSQSCERARVTLVEWRHQMDDMKARCGDVVKVIRERIKQVKLAQSG
jgi:hypothetical protein